MGVTVATPTLISRLRTATPLLLYGVRLWAAVCLALFLAFWLELEIHPGRARRPLSCANPCSVHRCAKAGFA